MSDIETSPLGDIRNRAVPCRGCGVSTWNYSAFCSACLDDDTFAEVVQPLPGEQYERTDEEAREDAEHELRSVVP